jgi:hypothetical protein
VNGGTPLVTSLRALRYAPVLVDDLAAAERLVPFAGELATPDVPLSAPELVRWTRAWLVALQGVLHDRGAIGSAQPWTVTIPRAELPALKGDPDGRRRAAAVALLERCGLLRSGVDPALVMLAEPAFTPHRAGLELSWGAICRAVRWEPAPLLVVRGLAEQVSPPQQPVPVTLRDLIDRSGYAAKQVRSANARLVEARVVSVQESAGMPSEYCFGTVATSGDASERLGVRPTVSVAQPAALPPIEPPARAAAGRRVALRMTLNGVTVTLGAGLSPHVELGPDGVPHLSFDPPPES